MFLSPLSLCFLMMVWLVEVAMVQSGTQTHDGYFRTGETTSGAFPRGALYVLLVLKLTGCELNVCLCLCVSVSEYLCVSVCDLLLVPRQVCLFHHRGCC